MAGVRKAATLWRVHLLSFLVDAFYRVSAAHSVSTCCLRMPLALVKGALNNLDSSAGAILLSVASGANQWSK